jgi:hypothetical protein
MSNSRPFSISETFIILLTAIGLMPGGSVTKIGRTYKKWTYIATKQNIQLTKNSMSHNISQYNTSTMKRIQCTINRIQDTEHRKITEYTETTKYENLSNII